MGEQPMLSGILYCADCGKALRIFRGASIDSDKFSYNCGNYRSGTKGNNCTPHNIRVSALEYLISDNIRAITQHVAHNEKVFAENLMQKSIKSQKSELARKQKELTKAKRRAEELDKLIIKLFEQHALENLSQERYLKMMQGYEQERHSLNVIIQAGEHELSQTQDTMANIGKFTAIAKKYLNLQPQELDGTILRELIKKVVIHEKIKPTAKSSKVISQQIDIYYNFVGVLGCWGCEDGAKLRNSVAWYSFSDYALSVMKSPQRLGIVSSHWGVKEYPCGVYDTSLGDFMFRLLLSSEISTTPSK